MRCNRVGREPEWREHLARDRSRARRPCHDLARVLSIMLSGLLLFELTRPAMACGPGFVEPVFVFTDSPDLPFAEFTRGKIGIVQPTFGSKTLVIAYRYLNGGSFTTDEQKALVEALRGAAPEDDGRQAIKAWVAARKEFLKEGEKLPDIYSERKFTGYDFFPNCARNAFEVATETLKDRAAKYGVQDRNLRAWLTAQDTVFQNCSAGATLPRELGPESAVWLRKDRDYQIAAALFYSLNFDAAQARFERIAADSESPWQRTADYLVARTLVRRASLLGDEKERREAYEQAEVRLQMVLAGNSAFYDGALRLLGLVKYRAHPQERIRELGRILAAGSGNANLRQDLIDYVWLRDKFQGQIERAERRRKEALESAEKKSPYFLFSDQATKARYEAIQRGDLMPITLYPKRPDGQEDYARACTKDFNADVTEAEILLAFESEWGRKLTPDENKEVREKRALAIESREWLISPNRKIANAGSSPDEDCEKDCDGIAVDQLPDLLRGGDLSDWIFTMKSKEPDAYAHAFSKWRDTGASTWLLASLARADMSSPQVARLLRAAEKVAHDDPAFPSLAYHLVRLKTAAGRTSEARQLVDEILSWPPETLPVSARNQFAEQRTKLASNLAEYLKFAPRKPVAFYDEGSYGSISELVRISKSGWNPEYYSESREEYERDIDERFRDLLPWDDQSAFDDSTVDAFNWHFPLTVLADASRNHALPGYLRRHLVLAVWTRAILLDNEMVAQQIAPEVRMVAPEMAAVFNSYVRAQTSKERKHAALYVLLKFPKLSPFVPGGIPEFVTAEETLYDFEFAWWCEPAKTDYNQEGQEVPKIVPHPGFLSPVELETARKELTILSAAGDGKSYLGKQVIEWAKDSPNDPRVPEALFIAAKANESYKYGCNSWENDEETKEAVETLLREQYPQSPWTAKLHENDN
jgi:hypothetical protein